MDVGSAGAAPGVSVGTWAVVVEGASDAAGNVSHGWPSTDSGCDVEVGVVVVALVGVAQGSVGAVDSGSVTAALGNGDGVCVGCACTLLTPVIVSTATALTIMSGLRHVSIFGHRVPWGGDALSTVHIPSRSGLPY